MTFDDGHRDVLDVAMPMLRERGIPAVAFAVAGLIGFIGVFADWFSLAYEVSGTKVVLDFYGTADGTGAIAVAASLGALMFGCAFSNRAMFSSIALTSAGADQPCQKVRVTSAW